MFVDTNLKMAAPQVVAAGSHHGSMVGPGNLFKWPMV